ncbi:MAG: L-2-hydroxyglutarate oxidase [Bacteroidota bacterium]
MSHYNALIIGAGAVGLATALRLQTRRPNWTIAVLDKEEQVAAHQTGNNSGVIHSGVYYQPGGTRATLCRKGYNELLAFAVEHHVPFKLTGKFIVAITNAEVPRLRNIMERGIANGLTGLEWLETAAFRERAPQLGGVAALWVPQAGIISYRAVTEKYAERFQALGGRLHLGERVAGISRSPSGWWVETETSQVPGFSPTAMGQAVRKYQADNIINCAGLYSDKLTALSGEQPDVKILPFRGEYYELAPATASQVPALVYPVPNPNFPFLGVHLTPTIDGRVEAGPNAVLAYAREGYTNRQIQWRELRETLAYSGFRSLARKYWRDGAKELHRSYSKSAFLRALQPLLPTLQRKDLLPGGAGVRAMAVAPDGTMIDDFLFYKGPGIVNVANAPSPAATASLAIGEAVVDELLG